MVDVAGNRTKRVYSAKSLKEKLQERYNNYLYFAEVNGTKNEVTNGVRQNERILKMILQELTWLLPKSVKYRLVRCLLIWTLSNKPQHQWYEFFMSVVASNVVDISASHYQACHSMSCCYTVFVWAASTTFTIWVMFRTWLHIWIEMVDRQTFQTRPICFLR